MKNIHSSVMITAASMTIAMGLNANNAFAADPAFTIERVSFESAGQTLIGNLYIPIGVDADNAAEAAVVTGAWTTVKEHMPATYAEELAERGTIALAFDFRTWGESEGETRSFENPAIKIADIEAAGRFLASRSDVTEVNGLGICASAGYMAVAAERSETFSSVALVAPWLHNNEIVDQVYGGPEGVYGLIEAGRAAARLEQQTGEPQLIPATGPAGSDALMPGVPYYTEVGLGLIPEWENTFNLASWELWLTFDGIRPANAIEQPVMIVHSDDAAIPHGARAFYDALSGEKEELWVDGVSQFDFYHRPDAVEASVDAVSDFFARK